MADKLFFCTGCIKHKKEYQHLRERTDFTSTIDYEMNETCIGSGYVSWLGDKVHMAETVQHLPQNHVLLLSQ